MTDPAIEAAQHAAAQHRRFEPRPLNSEIAAAREALAPIRELHTPSMSWCDGCDEAWPCATAQLVYSSEELGE